MLTIRLQRTGRKNLPSFRIVVAEHARPVKGKFMEILGFYLPQQKTSPFEVDKKKVEAWIAKGATPSDTLARLLKKNGVSGMDKFIKRYTKQRSKSAPPEEAPVAAAPAAPAAPAAEQAPEAAGDNAQPAA